MKLGGDLKPNYETIGITNSLIKQHLLTLSSNNVKHTQLEFSMHR